MVGLWCIYHLLEYLGTVPLWSWMAAGQAAGMLVCAGFNRGGRQFGQDALWKGLSYAIPAASDALMMSVARLPGRAPALVAGGRELSQQGHPGPHRYAAERSRRRASSLA